MMIQHIPGIVTNAVNTHGVYHVKWDKSLGELQKAKDLPGFFRGGVTGADGKLKAQALLKPVSAAPLVVNAAFSALSMITGQYFLSEINDKLAVIDKKLDGIKHFLEFEKRSELLANQYYVNEVINTLEFIQTNEYQKQATIQQLHTIRLSSFANFCFYTSSYNIEKHELNQLKTNTKRNMKQIPNIINEIGNIILFYKFALFTYHLSYYLELLLSGNTKSRYIEYIKKDVESKTEGYKEIVGYYTDELSGFLESTKAYDENVFLGLFTDIVFAPIPIIGAISSNMIKNHSKEKKKEARDEIIKQIGAFLDESQDYTPFAQIESSIGNYNRIVNNSRIELVYDNDKAYIKYTD